MSTKENQELETLIKEVFFNSRRKSVTPKKVRLKSIIKRGFYEAAFKDLIIFTSHILVTMTNMFSLILSAIIPLKK